MLAKFVRFLLATVLLECSDQIGDDDLIVCSSFVSRPLHNLHWNREERDRCSVGTFQISGRIKVVSHSRIIARDEIHVVVESDNVRVVVDAPDMLLPTLVVL